MGISLQCDVYSEQLDHDAADHDAADHMVEHGSAAAIDGQVQVFRWYLPYIAQRRSFLDWGCHHAPDSALLRLTLGDDVEITPVLCQTFAWRRQVTRLSGTGRGSDLATAGLRALLPLHVVRASTSCAVAERVESMRWPGHARAIGRCRPVSRSIRSPVAPRRGHCMAMSTPVIPRGRSGPESWP